MPAPAPTVTAPTDWASFWTMVDWKESLPPFSVTGTVPIRAALPNIPRLSRMSVPLEPFRLMAEAAESVALSVRVTAPPMFATPVKPKALEKVCVPVPIRSKLRLPLMAPPKVVETVEAKVSVAAVPAVLVMIPPPPGRIFADCKRSKAWLLPLRSNVPAFAMRVWSTAPVPLV